MNFTQQYIHIYNVCRLTLDSDSLKNVTKKIKSAIDRKKANSAGTTNHSPDFCLAHTAKIAPIRGPIIKPNEKAIPTSAYGNNITPLINGSRTCILYLSQ